MKRSLLLLLSSAIVGIGCSAHAQQAIMDAGQLDPAAIAKFYKKPGYSPYAGRNYPTRVFWGDEHVHTGWSADAGMSGATLTPEDAVRFARGEQVKSNSGQPVKLRGRSIGSLSPTIPTAWARSRRSRQAIRSSWPTRSRRNGAT